MLKLCEILGLLCFAINAGRNYIFNNNIKGQYKFINSLTTFILAALPRLDPVITGLRHSYDFGDHVSANCTSDMSNPPAKLTWFLNNDKVSSV